MEYQALVRDLLSEPSITRLADIRQVGFTVFPQQSRLQHTIESVNLAAELLKKAPSASRSVQMHLIAAVALEDVGRAPFSNSLESVFTRLPGLLTASPVDVERSVLIVRHLETTEKLLSRNGLCLNEVLELLHGRPPWKRARWATALVHGALDIDRLQYVAGDMARADGISYDVTAIGRGLVMDEGCDATVLDVSSVDPVIEFLLRRARLYAEIYYEPAKLALELIVGEFLRQVWEMAAAGVEGWEDVSEPRTVEDFLKWTDSTVLGTFQGARWDSNVPDSLRTLRELVRGGKLQVAELRQRGRPVVDLYALRTCVASVRDRLLDGENRWLLDGEDLPLLRVYQPDSIYVLNRSRYRDLATLPELAANADMVRRMKHCPILVFPTHHFPTIQNTANAVGLVLHTIIPLDCIKQMLDASPGLPLAFV